MRPDMAKVVRDCRRAGGREMVRGRSPKDVEDLPQRESMGSPHSHWHSSKERNTHWAPLKRYLDKQVGRRWDDVYSEIRQTFVSSKSVDHDVLERVARTVMTRGLFVDNGVVLEHSPYGEPSPPVDLYVHPETGLLCRPERWPRWKGFGNRADPDVRVFSASFELRRIDGVWYAVTLAPVTAPLADIFVTVDKDGAKTERRRVIKQSICRDVVTGAVYDDRRMVYLSPGATYATAKRQLSHADLKTYGLLAS